MYNKSVGYNPTLFLKGKALLHFNFYFHTYVVSKPKLFKYDF